MKPGRGRLRGLLLLAALGAGALLLLRVALYRPAAVTGDAPRDWYILYRDPQSDRLRAMAYIVTYGKAPSDPARTIRTRSPMTTSARSTA